ncbi:MAG TPA: hypothetical protein VIN58_14585 [Roseateles sp.]
MDTRLMSRQLPVRAIIAAATTAAIVLPITAQTQSANELYQQERADCLAGRTSQSQADCLYEARSALRDRRAGGLEPGASGPITAPMHHDAGSTDALPARADRG